MGRLATKQVARTKRMNAKAAAIESVEASAIAKTVIENKWHIKSNTPITTTR